MGRIAGNSKHYTLGLVDSTGKLRSHSVPLTSVTTILSVLPKDGLQWWGYKLGTHAMGEWLSTLTPDGINDALNQERAEWYDACKKQKTITPYTELKAAGERGTKVHDIVERLLKGEKPRVPKEVAGYVHAYHEWAMDWDIEPAVHSVEIPVFSIEHRYAGTLDLLLQDSTLHFKLVDFKTSSGIHDSHLIQLAPYAHAIKEMGIVPPGANIEKWVVRLGSEGDFEARQSDKGMDLFLAAKALYEGLAA